MSKRNRYARHDKQSIMEKAQSFGSKCFVYATAYGYTIDNSKPVGFQDYYEVCGQNVRLVEVKFG